MLRPTASQTARTAKRITLSLWCVLTTIDFLRLLLRFIGSSPCRLVGRRPNNGRLTAVPICARGLPRWYGRKLDHAFSGQKSPESVRLGQKNDPGLRLAFIGVPCVGQIGAVFFVSSDCAACG